MNSVPLITRAIGTSGIATRIETEMAKQVGRPRQLTVLALLVGIAVSLSRHGKVRLREVAPLLNDLPRSQRTALGLTGPVEPHNVYYLWSQVNKALAPTDPNNEQHCKLSQKLLDDLSDALLDVTLAGMPRDTRVVMDDTAVETWGRRRAIKSDKDARQYRDRGRRIDTDARHGHRTPTAVADTDKLYGYHVTALGQSCGANIFERIRLRAANASPAPAGVALLTDTVNARERAGMSGIDAVLADRGFTYAKEQSWATPLRLLGIANIQDMHPLDKRFVTSGRGYDIVDGTPHCHRMPTRLRKLTRPTNLSQAPLTANPTKKEQEAHAERAQQVAQFDADVAEREKYAFERHGKTANGERWSCPAKVGKVLCEGCPLAVPAAEDAPTIVDPPLMPPAQLRKERPACAQQTILIAWNENEKHRQPHAWGTAEWRSTYAARTRIEGAFGTVKNRGGLVKGWIHVLGLVKTSLMTMLLFAMHNLRVRAANGHHLPEGPEAIKVDDELLVDPDTGEVLEHVERREPPART
ncbi:transposase [Janibacter anophelis]|uniref:transposase n=1 Tax=Janibacter anophelis TaxID=319054 RepID=UPI0008305F9F|nr:transposase [Janibacter anophelis]